MSDKITQVFYCNDCNGYIKVKLNMSLNHGVKVECPNCGRQHPRTIRDGQIVDDYSRENAEIISPPSSCYSKEPFTDNIKPHARNGVVMNDNFWRERWLQISEREKSG